MGFQSVVTGVNSVAIGAGSHDNGLSNVVSVGNFGAERQIVYVAPGTVAPDSTNAVNGGQLFAVQQSANQALTAANSANSAAAEALSAANRANTTAAQVLTSANAVSRSLDQVAQQVGNLARDANAGTATAIASANIPQAYGPRSTAIGAAFGTWKGETSFAVGASHNFNRFSLRGSFNVNSDGSTGGGAGFGLQF